jgi:DNA integrity scanning protein DisA with diadenylate cyclase activity
MTHSNPSTPLQIALDDLDLHAPQTNPTTIESVIDLAIEIAREGREGRRVGTLFTVGAEHDVLARSRCLILDPLTGHPPEKRRVDDSLARETLKELAHLDGGFVISGDGIALSACRYFEARLPANEQPLGLGTRHLAAASISMTTPALAVVVSESSIVRVFSGGSLITEILPELWLLHRYMPHIARPTLTGDQEHNLAIVSETR